MSGDIVGSLFPGDSPFEVSPAQSAQVLETKWHEYSDEAIQSTISRLGATNSPSEAPSNPYHDTLRVLSSAVHRLSKARAELEESRKELLEREAARRTRADELMRELQPSEQEVARRLLQSLFPDDDESRREVQRKHSDTVRERSDRLKSRSHSTDTSAVTGIFPDRSPRGLCSHGRESARPTPGPYNVCRDHHVQ